MYCLTLSKLSSCSKDPQSTTTLFSRRTSNFTATTGDGKKMPTVRARRTEALDAQNIMNLLKSDTYLEFTKINVIDIIEQAVLSVTLEDEKGELIGR